MNKDSKNEFYLIDPHPVMPILVALFGPVAGLGLEVDPRGLSHVTRWICQVRAWPTQGIVHLTF